MSFVHWLCGTLSVRIERRGKLHAHKVGSEDLCCTSENNLPLNHSFWFIKFQWILSFVPTVDFYYVCQSSTQAVYRKCSNSAIGLNIR
mmetsp:Transcript_28025/g.26876  ORF Transcript_28025/g.26876 Transcript_28025/m.26876 type:complete len:88 (+) Transcript_28025:447-710(+)